MCEHRLNVGPQALIGRENHVRDLAAEAHYVEQHLVRDPGVACEVAVAQEPNRVAPQEGAQRRPAAAEHARARHRFVAPQAVQLRAVKVQ